MVQAKSGTQIPAAQDEADALLRQCHHLQANEADDFSSIIWKSCSQRKNRPPR